jgi:hypothetical protein
MNTALMCSCLIWSISLAMSPAEASLSVEKPTGAWNSMP